MNISEKQLKKIIEEELEKISEESEAVNQLVIRTAEEALKKVSEEERNAIIAYIDLLKSGEIK